MSRLGWTIRTRMGSLASARGSTGRRREARQHLRHGRIDELAVRILLDDGGGRRSPGNAPGGDVDDLECEGTLVVAHEGVPHALAAAVGAIGEVVAKRGGGLLAQADRVP